MKKVVVDRRQFLSSTVGGLVVPGSVAGLVAACSDREPVGAPLATRASAIKGDYGPLNNDQGILLLPEDFQMRAFGFIGDPMTNGQPTPIALDGMGAFADGPNRVRLVRNHEDRNGPTTPIGPNPYDPVGGGGNTTLVVDAARKLVTDFVSLSGTTVNCAGGVTPWGSWISCEETVVGPREGFAKTHGWCFEIPARANAPVNPVPLKAMGRFSHEAVSVDPRTGIVYETEDNGYPPGSGFFRFLPNQYGNLAAGGRLQMAAIKDQPKLEIFRGSAAGIQVGDTFDVVWVDIDLTDPGDDNTEDDRMAALFLNGFEKGGVVFSRLEGSWYGEGSIFFHDTNAGRAREGHVWQYVPGAGEGQGGADDVGLLRLIFESPGSNVLDNPDNITVTPRGGLLLCEDGSGVQFLRGLTRSGEIFDFARNQLNDAEFAGACFSPNGHTLFVNIQGRTSGVATAPGVKGSGVTLAIWGPWAKGAL